MFTSSVEISRNLPVDQSLDWEHFCPPRAPGWNGFHAWLSAITRQFWAGVNCQSTPQISIPSPGVAARQLADHPFKFWGIINAQRKQKKASEGSSGLFRWSFNPQHAFDESRFTRSCHIVITFFPARGRLVPERITFANDQLRKTERFCHRTRSRENFGADMFPFPHRCHTGPGTPIYQTRPAHGRSISRKDTRVIHPTWILMARKLLKVWWVIVLIISTPIFRSVSNVCKCRSIIGIKVSVSWILEWRFCWTCADRRIYPFHFFGPQYCGDIAGLEQRIMVATFDQMAKPHLDVRCVYGCHNDKTRARTLLSGNWMAHFSPMDILQARGDLPGIQMPSGFTRCDRQRMVGFCPSETCD